MEKFLRDQNILVEIVLRPLLFLHSDWSRFCDQKVIAPFRRRGLLLFQNGFFASSSFLEQKRFFENYFRS